jgi:hypothetical protein
MFDLELLETAFVCATGPACLAWTISLSVMGALTSISEGASLGQTILMTSINIGLSVAGGEIIGDDGDLWSAEASGAASAAITNSVSNLLNGRDLGDNLFDAIAVSAVTAGISYGLQNGLAQAVSQASAGEGQAESGSGESTVEARAREQAAGAAATQASEGVSVESVLKANGVGSWSEDSFMMWALGPDASSGTGMVVGDDGRPVQLAWTVEVGVSINFQIGPININFATGVAIDGSLNVAVVNTPGGGLGIGGLASGGAQIQGSNAATVYDLKGVFFNTSSGAGAGPSASWETFSGPSDHGFVTGWGFTAGVGVGGGASAGASNTYVTPLRTPRP